MTGVPALELPVYHLPRASAAARDTFDIREGRMARLNNPPLSAYRFMWLLVMFDLPVITKPERTAATRFRQWLLDEGYEMSS